MGLRYGPRACDEMQSFKMKRLHMQTKQGPLDRLSQVRDFRRVQNPMLTPESPKPQAGSQRRHRLSLPSPLSFTKDRELCAAPPFSRALLSAFRSTFSSSTRTLCDISKCLMRFDAICVMLSMQSAGSQAKGIHSWSHLKPRGRTI